MVVVAAAEVVVAAALPPERLFAPLSSNCPITSLVSLVILHQMIYITPNQTKPVPNARSLLPGVVGDELTPPDDTQIKPAPNAKSLLSGEVGEEFIYLNSSTFGYISLAFYHRDQLSGYALNLTLISLFGCKESHERRKGRKFTPVHHDQLSGYPLSLTVISLFGVQREPQKKKKQRIYMYSCHRTVHIQEKNKDSRTTRVKMAPFFF